MYIDGVDKVVLLGFISTHNHTFYNFMVIRMVYTLSEVACQYFRMETHEPHGRPFGQVGSPTWNC